MKIVIITLLFISSLFSSDLTWRSYQEAYNMMSDKILKKPVLVFVSSKNCHYCKKSLNEFNSDDEFKLFLEKNYELVYIDQMTDFVPADLYAFSTPSFFILNPKDLSLLVKEPAVGAIPVQDMGRWLSDIVYKYKTQF